MTLIRNRTLASRTSGDIIRKIHAFALTCDCEYVWVLYSRNEVEELFESLWNPSETIQPAIDRHHRLVLSSRTNIFYPIILHDNGYPVSSDTTPHLRTPIGDFSTDFLSILRPRTLVHTLCTVKSDKIYSNRFTQRNICQI